jgi:virginiamycin B lyase
MRVVKAYPAMRVAIVLALILVAGAVVAAPGPPDSFPDQGVSPPGSAYLALLPDGEMKRRFILDCTGCHVWTRDWVQLPDGGYPDSGSWSASVQKMLAMFGQGTGFPIISSWPDPIELGPWLRRHLSGDPEPQEIPPDLLPERDPDLTEYPIPVPADLPHDLMVDDEGQVLITGMFTHQVYRLDPETGSFETTSIPVPNANPRALDLDAEGRWLLLLGAPGSVARHDPGTGGWDTWELGAYPHSIHLGGDGRIWWNGHFTVDPEIIGSLDPETGQVTRYEVPAQPTADSRLGQSTIPYGLRVAPDGVVWATQLRGGHLIRLDPATGEIRQWKMPTTHAGPRRLDVGPDGMIWIPEYSAGKLARFDPETETFREWDLPAPDALPYVVRVDQSTGLVWIGTGHGDLMASFDPAAERFTIYPLPTRGALIRHIDVDEERGEIWAAYGASPGIPSKVVRLRP